MKPSSLRASFWKRIERAQCQPTHTGWRSSPANTEECSMSFRRTLASMLVPLAALSISGSHVTAQAGNPGASLLVPITGVADLGGMFNGALLIDHFAEQTGGVAAIGTVTGTLTTTGTARNLVMQVTLPLDFDAIKARLNTDAALAQASCDVLHVELGGVSMNVLGSTIGLNPVVFDITSTMQSTARPSAPGIVTATRTAATPAGTVTPSLSANPTQPVVVGSQTPGVTTAPPQPVTGPAPVAAQTSLASLLCSVDRFRVISNPANVVQQLNAILAAFGATAGS